MWGRNFRVGEWIAWLAVAGFVVAALVAWGTGRAHAAAAACSGVDADYNGDGVRDTAIGDPDATVNGKSLAGTVTVAYGGAAGVVQVRQGLAWVPGDPEAGTRFGFSLTSGDLNADGCADLVVGAPYRDVNGAADAGAVYVIYGAPGGLGTGPASTFYVQERTSATSEPGDLFGYSLSAGKATGNTPYVAMGIPGEDVGTVRDAGAMAYVHGGVAAWVDQESSNVPGLSEPDDRFGASLASTPTHLIVGVPGEGFGTEAFAGGIVIFSHTLDATGRPTPLTGADQTSTNVGSAEAGDRFGTALAAAPLPASLAGESYVLVGSPGEDLGTAVDAGSASLYRIKGDGTVTTVIGALAQGVGGAGNTPETGDFFGQTVAMSLQGPLTLRLAVGVPGEESSEEHLDKGGIHIFTVRGDSTVTDAWFDPGYGIPGVPEQQMFVGASLAATPQALLVGVAKASGSASGAVYVFGWDSQSGTAPTQTFTPGEGGIPAGGAAFGASIR